MPKLTCASVRGSNSGTDSTDPKLVGESNEVDILINGIPTTALLDTGSCVSVISEKFHQDHLRDIKIQPLGNIINIECADGNSLPYSGYIDVTIDFSSALPNGKAQRCLLLVTPTTQYSKDTPVLIGTNILQELLNDCKDEFGDRFLQTAKLRTPWYLSFRSMVIRDRELRRNKDRIAIVRCAGTQKITLRPNESIEILGYTDKELDFPDTTAILQETENSSIPSYIDITPAVIRYQYRKNGAIAVNLSNLTTNTINIAPRSILCELQPVKVADEVFEKLELDHKRDEVIQELKIDESKQLAPEERERLVQLLRKHKDIFSVDETDIGNCSKIRHRVDLVDDIPFKQRHRRIPPAMVEEVQQHIEQLLAGGIIRPSKSPFTSNVVLVRKKSGKLRMCVDYRMLNKKTVKDSFALPRMEEIFDCLHGARYFTTLDMKSGYFQVEVEEEHKERTAFTVGAMGFYEYNRMPFGLTNAPATYQRLMQECLGNLNMSICLIYLDDLIIFSKTFEEHLERLDIILERLKECNLKLAPEKCVFFQPEVKFLGHVVTSNGISTDPDKVDKVRNWPVPSNSDELRSFLALAGYYRRFIHDFSRLTRPLSELLPPTSTKKGTKINKPEWNWTDREQKVFDNLKEKLTSAPILAYPDFNQPFELHTDASTKALGAVLYQKLDGRKRVIAYASRALSKAEQNYSAFKLEFLALKWAITEKFSDYLISKPFLVLTDNNPLTYVLTTAKLDATGQRWAAALGQYTFDITYRAGIKNTDADPLSRYPYEILQAEQTKMDDSNIQSIQSTECSEQITMNDSTIKAICSCITVPSFIETFPTANINILEAFEEPGQVMAQKEMQEIRSTQRQDPLVERWRRAVIDKALPKTTMVKGDLTMKRQFQNLFMKRGILFRKVQQGEEILEQLVVPEGYRKEVLRGLHDEVGHPGIERTMRLLRERFYWPGMYSDTEHWIKTCDRCLKRKDKPTQRAPLININTSYPLELVCFDYLTLEPAQGVGNVLIITDHYTKYALAIPTKNQTAKTTAETFFNHFIVHYGIPTRLHSDQGANFESELIKELCVLMNMKKSHTTPYHPQGNAGPERFNRTLLNMLGTLEADQKTNWKKYVNSLVFAYNCTPHEATRVAPYELMFGRKPRLPIDTAFENARKEEIQNKTAQDYLIDLKHRMEKTKRIVEDHVEKSKTKQKKYYNRSVKSANINVGDKVLVRRVAFEGKHKIQDKFEDDIYSVVEQPRSDIPVYRVKSGDKEKVLHRNLLYLIHSQFDSEDEPDVEPESPVVDVDKDASMRSREMSDVTEDSDGEDSDIVFSACQDGDARHSSSDTEVVVEEVEEVVDESKESEITGTSNKEVVAIEIIDTDDVKEISTDTEVVDETREVLADISDVEDEETDGVRSEDHDIDVIPEDTFDDIVDESEERDDGGGNDTETVGKEDVAEEASAKDAEEPAKDMDAEVVRRERPKPPPRRSMRDKRPPRKFEDFYMMEMQTRPLDKKIEAVNSIMSSGVLGGLDSEIAHKIMRAIFD